MNLINTSKDGDVFKLNGYVRYIVKLGDTVELFREMRGNARFLANLSDAELVLNGLWEK